MARCNGGGGKIPLGICLSPGLGSFPHFCPKTLPAPSPPNKTSSWRKGGEDLGRGGGGRSWGGKGGKHLRGRGRGERSWGKRGEKILKKGDRGEMMLGGEGGTDLGGEILKLASGRVYLSPSMCIHFRSQGRIPASARVYLSPSTRSRFSPSPAFISDRRAAFLPVCPGPFSPSS